MRIYGSYLPIRSTLNIDLNLSSVTFLKTKKTRKTELQAKSSPPFSISKYPKVGITIYTKIQFITKYANYPEPSSIRSFR